MRLENKVALVTSCRSRICTGTALRLAEAGARVMICGRNMAQGQETVRQIRQRGGRASFVLADVAAIADIRTTVDETIATYGRLDILVNSIGNEYAQDGELLNVSEMTWDRIAETALRGTFFCCQYALPFLQQAGGGTIINLIKQPPSVEFNAVTTICQGGVVAMTKAIAHQYPAQSVTANIIWIKPGDVPKFTVEPLAERVIHAPELSSSATVPEDTIPALPVFSPPFTDAVTAVLYLATRSSTIQGSTVVVSEVVPPEED